MNHPAPKCNTFPQVPASQCACCGTELSTGQGYDVPFIGAVGPRCVKKFGSFGQLLVWVEGRASALPELREAQVIGHRLVVGLRVLGFEIANQGGVLHVVRMTRKPVEVAKSWRKCRAEFERDLQIAAGLFGEDARVARAQAAAA